MELSVYSCMSGRYLCLFVVAALFSLSMPIAVMAKTSNAKEMTELLGFVRKYQRLEKAGKFSEALPYVRQTEILGEKLFGTESKTYAQILNGLASFYQTQGNMQKAEWLSKKSLGIRERLLGAVHPSVASSLNKLASLYHDQGLYSKAAPLYKRSLKIREATLGSNHKSLSHSLNNLASLYHDKGNFSAAEPLYRRSLRIAERTRGANHPIVGYCLNNLADLYRDLGRYSEAEPLLKRSLRIARRIGGSEHLAMANPLNNLAELYRAQKRYEEAISLSKRSLLIWERRLGANHSLVGTSLSNLAGLYVNQKKYSKAEPLYMRGIAIQKKARGQNHILVAFGLNGLAWLYLLQGRHNEAKLLYKKSLAIRMKVLGKGHPSVAKVFNNLSWLHLDQSRWQQAADSSRQAVSILIQRAGRDRQIGQGVKGKGQGEIDQGRGYFLTLVKSVFRVDLSDKSLNETFQMAQWAMQSQAAGALTEMSARGGAGSGELAKMARERQDKVRQWQTLEKLVNKRRGAGKDHLTLDSQLEAIDKRISEIDKRLVKDFPDYAALASPKPLSVMQAQALLKPDEALILLLDTPAAKPTPAETFIWAITKNKAVWRRAELGDKALANKVSRLRCGLDGSNWGDYSGWEAKTDWEKQAKAGQQAKRAKCIKLTGQTIADGDSPPFDFATAYELYQKLLAPVEDVIKGKKLLVVASGALTGLPLQVLLTQKPDAAFSDDAATYQKAAWLIKSHALTTLPSVATLKALRGIGKAAVSAPEPLIGFADPVFRQPSPNKETKQANLETGKADKKKVDLSLFRQSKVSQPKAPKMRSVMRSYASFFRGRSADLTTLAQSLPQLDGTRRELLEVGRVLKVNAKNILLGRAASETAVKQAKLADYRIVYFATHGLIAGDVKGLGEPALAFSLPAKATKLDDGLLTASEVTQLKLNADWLVMSACNTAAGDKPGAEALSGLARAFFYAGAKTLLVSHWPVGDEAAVALTTHTFKTMKDSPKLGRAEALRGSMLAMIEKGSLANAHPTNWAPFVLVGEGG